MCSELSHLYMVQEMGHLDDIYFCVPIITQYVAIFAIVAMTICSSNTKVPPEWQA